MTLESLEVRDQLRWDWYGINGIIGADEVDRRITTEKCEGTYGEWTIGNGEEGEDRSTYLFLSAYRCLWFNFSWL